MKISVTENKGNLLRFNVSGIDVTLANALRRIVISELPVMAVEKVVFEENTSILNDEFLAHRLGLIPLKTDLKTYVFQDKCSCDFEGCAKCTAKLSLKAEGPKTVYSKDLKSNDPKIIPVYDSIPIVKLTQKQSIKLEADAVLGTGRDHIKWQAGLASYSIEKDGSFSFFVESYGQLDADEMLKKSFEIFEEKVSLAKKLKV